jgi:hypothetical protein
MMNIWEWNGRTGSIEQADSFNVEELYAFPGCEQESYNSEHWHCCVILFPLLNHLTVQPWRKRQYSSVKRR